VAEARRTNAVIELVAQVGDFIADAALRLEQEGPLNDRLKPHDQLSQLNVLVQLEHPMTYPIVHQQVTAGALVLSGWCFDIATGDMYAYERTSRAFEVIDRANSRPRPTGFRAEGHERIASDLDCGLHVPT
jgi:carbonic anhydrase